MEKQIGERLDRLRGERRRKRDRGKGEEGST